MALIATGEAADKAKIASKLQRARCRIHINMSHRSGGLRARQANACLSQFRYVTALSQNARAMRHIHEAELLSWGNFQTHYQESLGPQAHMVRPHQTFLDSLGLKVEAVRWHQGLDMVCIRWMQLRAAADLTQYAKNFHLTCQRLDVQKRRVDKARRRANHLKQIMVQCVSDYERLEAEVLAVQGAIQALQNTPLISISRETAVSASASACDENADQTAQGM